MAARKGKTVSAKPAKPAAVVEDAPEVPTEEPFDWSTVFDATVAEFLDNVGVARGEAMAELEAWKARHPGQVPMAQWVQNWIQKYLPDQVLRAAANKLGIGAVQLVFEGKGPVQHSGAELV